MKSMTKYIRIFIFLIFLIPSDLFGWGMTGHRIIAQLAEENISRRTRKKINKLLKDIPMAYWSNWGDFIKSDTTEKWEHTYQWHYINIPGNLKYQQFLDEIKGAEHENVYSQIPVLQETLKNKAVSKEEKLTALYLIIHLVGDMHQPMHVGRFEDRGGNTIDVQWFDDHTNIHAVWDSRLINYENYSYTEYTKILNTIDKKQKATIQSGTLEDWLFETYQIANEIYSSIKPKEELRYEYQYKYKDTVELLLQRAGIRLARILNETF